MIQARLDWQGEQAVANVAAASWGGVRAVADLLSQAGREVLGVPGPAPSRPGEAPHRQAGGLQSGLVVELDEQARTARFGLSRKVLIQGLSLEHGTRRGLAPRPFIAAVIRRMQARRLALLTQGR